MEPEGLWQRLVAAPRDRRPIFLPLYPFPTPASQVVAWWGYPNISFSPCPPEKALPEQRKGTKEKEPIRIVVWSPPSLLLRSLGSGLDLHLDLRVHLLSPLLLGGRCLVFGSLVYSRCAPRTCFVTTTLRATITMENVTVRESARLRARRAAELDSTRPQASTQPGPDPATTAIATPSTVQPRPAPVSGGPTTSRRHKGFPLDSPAHGNQSFPLI